MTLTSLDIDQLEDGEESALLWVRVRDAVQMLWRDNMKKHDEDSIIESLSRYGYQDKSRYDKTLGAIKHGNGRVYALALMEEAGRYELPRGIRKEKDTGYWVMQIDFGIDADSIDEAKAYAVDANNLTIPFFDPELLAEIWDAEKLFSLVSDLDVKPVSIRGEDFDMWEKAVNPEEPPEGPEPQTDRAEELREKWGVETGQLWQLGEHRLICGDCTRGDVVERVMDGEQAGAIVTDPPYGIGIEYDVFVVNENELKPLIVSFMDIIKSVPSAAFTPGVPNMWLYPQPAWVGAWVHPAPSGSCPWGFAGTNPILYYGKDPYLTAGLGRRPESVTMATDRRGEDDHPTSKPIDFWCWLVERLSPQKGNIVLDPFLGSGTTLIACERLNRKCRAVEISPAYCAVAIERWHEMTGLDPKTLD